MSEGWGQGCTRLRPLPLRAAAGLRQPSARAVLSSMHPNPYRLAPPWTQGSASWRSAHGLARWAKGKWQLGTARGGRQSLELHVVAHLGSRIHGVERPGEEGHPGRNVQDEPFPPKRQRSSVSGAVLPGRSVQRKKPRASWNPSLLPSRPRPHNGDPGQSVGIRACHRERVLLQQGAPPKRRNPLSADRRGEDPSPSSAGTGTQGPSAHDDPQQGRCRQSWVELDGPSPAHTGVLTSPGVP